MTKLPILSADLIAELNKDFPEQSPDPSDSERELWMKAGERRVVRMLVVKLRQLEEEETLSEM